MVPLINIALRGARSASNQLLGAADKLDLMHAAGADFNRQLNQLCQAIERTMAYELIQVYPQQMIRGFFSGVLNDPEQPDTKHWRINGLDGVEQYVNGLPMYTITMACYEGEQLTHSLVINPATNEEFMAARGKGVQLNNRRLRVSQRSQLAGAQIYGALLTDQPQDSTFAAFQAIQKVLYSQQQPVTINR